MDFNDLIINPIFYGTKKLEQKKKIMDISEILNLKLYHLNHCVFMKSF